MFTWNPGAARIALILAGTVATLAPAGAETLFPTFTSERPRWGVGLGALSEDEGYRGIGRETELLPILYYESDRFRLLGPQAEYRVLGSKTSALNLRADFRFDGFEAADGAIFSGMRERKGSVFVGVSGRHAASWGELTFDLVKATSASRGVRGGVTYGVPFRHAAWTVYPKIGIEYFDRKFVDYYYGVGAAEVRPDRPAYRGKASVNLDLGVDLQYELGANHTVLGSIKYRGFGSAIKDSPLIEKSGSPRFTLGYVYRF